MTIIEMRKKQRELLERAREALDEINANTDEARAAELESRHETIMAEWDGLEVKIEREQRHAKAISAMAEAIDPRRPHGENRAAQADHSQEGETSNQARDYAAIYLDAIRNGVANLSPAEQRVMMQHRGESRAQAVGTDSAGGYLVPDAALQQLIKTMAIWGPMYDATWTSEIVTSGGNRLPWPTTNDTANSGRIKAENAAVDDDGTDDVVFGEVQLDAYWYNTGMVKVPWELLTDAAMPVEAIITELFGERLARTANTLLTTGTGTAQPRGIITAAGAGVTAAATTAITGDELINLVHSVDAAYRASPKCGWMFNDLTFAAIRKLKDGQGNYLWSMGDIQAGAPATLLGYPFRVNQAMANLEASAEPITFGDHGKYMVRKVQGIQTMTLRERYAENFQIGMVAHIRFDGELLDTAAVKTLTMAAA